LNRGEPIVAVDVIYEDEPVPQGFVKVARDMSKGSHQRSFLCFRRARSPPQESGAEGIADRGERGSEDAHAEEDGPLVDVVIAGQDENPGEGFVRLDKPLCRSERPLFLCYRRARSFGGGEPAGGWPPTQGVRVGDMVDLKDSTGKWCVAQVRLVTEELVSVRPRDLDWDEELPLLSSRLAMAGTHTGVAVEGEPGENAPGAMSVRPQGALWSWTTGELADMVARMEARLEEVEGQPAGGPGEPDDFCRQALPAFMEVCLASSYPAEEDDATLLGMLEGLKVAYALLARVLSRLGEAPCPLPLLRALSMVFNADPACSYFFETYGFGPARNLILKPASCPYLSATSSASALAHSLGPGPSRTNASTGRQHPQYHRAGEVSAFLILLLNHWAATGGFDAMMARIREAPLAEVTVYLGHLQRAFPFYSSREANRSFGDNIIEGVRRHALGRLTHITNDELGVLNRGSAAQDVLDGVDREAFRLLSVWYKEGPQLQEIQEMTLLWHAWRLLTCPYLNFRIRGLHLINELAEMALRKESKRATGGAALGGGQWYGNADGNTSGNQNVTKWLRLDFFLGWVVRERVLEVVLGLPEALGTHPGLGDTHFELVRRVELLLTLLADNGLLNTDHLDALWWAASPLHPDAQVRTVYRLIGVVAEKLAQRKNRSLLLAMHVRLESDLPQPYETQHIELIHAVAEAAITLEHSLPRERALGPGSGKHGEEDEDDEDEGEGAGIEERGKGVEGEDALPDPLGLNLLWNAVVGPSGENDAAGASSIPTDPPVGLPSVSSTSSLSSFITVPGTTSAMGMCLKRDAVEVCVQAIISLLIKQGNKDILARYMKRSVLALERGRRVAGVLYLLYHLSEKQPVTEPYHHQHSHVRPQAKVVRATLLNFLSGCAGDGGIFCTILEGLKSYRDKARRAAIAKGLLQQDGDEKKEEEMVEEGDWHVQGVRQQLSWSSSTSTEEGEHNEEQEEEDGLVMGATMTGDGGSHLSYKEEVSTRLNFMRYVSENSEKEQQLEYQSHLWPLWEMLVLQPLCRAERTLFFRWLLTLMPDESPFTTSSTLRYGGPLPSSQQPQLQLSSSYVSSCLDPATVHDLFRGCLTEGRAGEYGVAGYQCLERYFRLVNGREQRLALPLSATEFSVTDYDGLEGLEAIWRVYWRASYKVVVNSACVFLINLHSRLQSRNSQILKRASVWADLVRHCKEIIMHESTEDREGGDTGTEFAQTPIRPVMVRRALALLRLFLEELQTPRVREASAASALNPGPGQVAVQVDVRQLEEGLNGVRGGRHGAYSQQLRYLFRDIVSIGALRMRVAADMKHRVSQVRLTSTANQVMYSDQHDDLLLSSGKSNLPRRFHAVLLPKPMADTIHVNPKTRPGVSLLEGEDESAPLLDLSQDRAFFERVFALVAPEPRLVEDAWALLEMVPDIPFIEETIRCLGGALPVDQADLSSKDTVKIEVEGLTSGHSSNRASSCRNITTWDGLLHGRSPMRFLYNLRLIKDKILAPASDPYASTREHHAALCWELAFVKMGGLAYLVEVLAGWDIASQSKNPSLDKSALSALIERIGSFMPPIRYLNGVGEVGVARSGSLAGRRHHLSFSSSSSLFRGAQEGEEEGGVMEGKGLIMRNVALDMEEKGPGELATGMADVKLVSGFCGNRPARTSLARGRDEEADVETETRMEQEGDQERRRLRIHLASAAVFARVDRGALTNRLVEVLYELTKSVRDRPSPSRARNDDSSDDEESSSWDPAAVAGGGASLTTASAGKKSDLRAQGSRRGRLAAGGAGDSTGLRGARDLLRRPSWVDQKEWTGDLFGTDGGKREQSLVPTPASEDVALVETTLDLLVSLGAGGEGLLDVILGSPLLRQLLHFGLLLAPDEALRRAIARGVHRLCVEGRRRRERKEAQAEEKEGRKKRNIETSAEDNKISKETRSLSHRAVLDPVRGFLHPLIDLVETVGEEGGGCVEYFKLLTRLLKAPDALLEVDPEGMACKLAGQIRRRRVVEASETDEDQVLQGLLTSLRALLAFLPHRGDGTRSVKVMLGQGGLLQELFDRCLFAMPSTDPNTARYIETPPPPKCKHPVSRNLALGLVLELSAECPDNLRKVVAVLERHNPLGLSADEKERRRLKVARRRQKSNQHGGGGGGQIWGRQRSGSLGASGQLALNAASSSAAASSLQCGLSKNRTGYVGLKNLGCICYMNSTLQQLFHVKGFREGILAFEDAEEDKEESLMYQLQRVFAHLQESDKAYFNPQGFCHALKNWDGEPTDVFVQQDVSDFLLMFFQQVEGMTQGTKCEEVLRHAFGGTLVHELIAEGGRYSSRLEPCYFLSVMVQNIQTLDQALEAYISEEILSDYTWETKDPLTGKAMKEATPTVKRASLAALPRHLILHLKRFEFDYETMQQIKINDRLEFPVDLDMYPYTLEGRTAVRKGGTGISAAGNAEDAAELRERTQSAAGHPPEYYLYRLAGVVIHMGTANSGHYYSYIRERGGERSGWFEFNDTVVTDFNPADLEVECFGGQETRGGTGGGGYHGGRNWARERIRNAFLLVYDRCDIRAEDDALNTVAHRPQVPTPILEEILWENLDFWRKTNILTRPYFEFMEQLLEPVYRPTAVQREEQAEDPGQAALLESGLRLATKFMLGTLTEARDWEGVRTWVPRLLKAYARCLPACMWVVGMLSCDEQHADEGGGLLWDLLLDTEEKEGQVAVVQLLDQVVTIMLDGSSTDSDEDTKHEGVERRGPAEAHVTACLSLFGALLRMRHRVAELVRPTGGIGKVDSYIYLLGLLASKMEGARRMVLEDAAGTCLLDLLQIAKKKLEVWAVGKVFGSRREAELLLGSAEQAAADIGPCRDTFASAEREDDDLDVPAVVQPLLGNLLRACVIPTPGGATPPMTQWSAQALEPHHVMSLAERQMVCSIDFCSCLILSVDSPEAKARMRPFFQHFLWENPARTQEIQEAMVRLLEQGGTGGNGQQKEESPSRRSDEGTGVIKPVFRSLMLVLGVKDSLREERVSLSLPRILAALKTQKSRQRATELGLWMLMRLARENMLVRQWFHDGAVVLASTPVASPERREKAPKRTSSFTSLLTFGGGAVKGGSGGASAEEEKKGKIVCREEAQWAEKWLVDQQGRSSGGSGKGDFFNATTSGWMGGGSSKAQYHGDAGSTAGARSGVRSGAAVQQRVLKGIRNLSRGQNLPLDYDSDMDPQEIVGRHIDIQWSGDEHYRGVVTHFSPRSGEHHVRYEDGDERDYRLQERQHIFIDPSQPSFADTSG
jgi:ubiquitin C-terminal hydrolase